MQQLPAAGLKSVAGPDTTEKAGTGTAFASHPRDTDFSGF